MPNYLNMMPTIKKSSSQTTMKMGMIHQRNLVVKRSSPVQENTTKGIDFRSMKNNLKNNNRSGCRSCRGTF
jgi:hypothetical protein